MEDLWSTESDLHESFTTVNSNITEEYVDVTLRLGPKRSALYIVIPISIIYCIIFLTGLIGNISTCIVISRNKSMHTATNYYLFSLAISDLLLLVSGLPQEMYSIWSRYPYIFGEVFCVLRGLAAETSANATVLTITAFTVERYVAICHPFLSHTMSKLSRAIKLILAVWIVALCFAIPQALQFGVIQEPTAQCLVKRILIEHSFEVSTFLFFVAPMTLITVLYALIGLRLRSSSMMKRDRHTTVSSKNSETCITGSDVKRSCRHQHGQSSRRVIKMLVAVVVAFFICWAPFHAQRLVAIYGLSITQKPHMLKIYEIVTYISGVLYYVSTTVNPVLYHIMSNKFREAFKETFARCCGRPRTQRRSYSILSRSAGAGISGGVGANHGPNSKFRQPQESTDSGTSMTQRQSDESTCTHPAGITGCQFGRENLDTDLTDNYGESNINQQRLIHSDIGNSIVIKHDLKNESNLSLSSKKRYESNKFLRIFRCLTIRKLDETLQSAYPSPVKEPSIMEKNTPDSLYVASCNVSNSSLKDVENGALEDELTIYMKEIQSREIAKS